MKECNPVYRTHKFLFFALLLIKNLYKYRTPVTAKQIGSLQQYVVVQRSNLYLHSERVYKSSCLRTVSAAIWAIISSASLAAISRAGFITSRLAWRTFTSSDVFCSFSRPTIQYIINTDLSAFMSQSAKFFSEAYIKAIILTVVTDWRLTQLAGALIIWLNKTKLQTDQRKKIF